MIENRIKFGEAELKRFTDKYPKENIKQYQSLLSRLRILDNFNRLKNPDHKPLMQMDYYTVYSLLSEDVHFTLYGTNENTVRHRGGIHIDLEKKGMSSLRNATTAYSMLLDYMNMMTVVYRLKQANEISRFRKIEKSHRKAYITLDA